MKKTELKFNERQNEHDVSFEWTQNIDQLRRFVNPIPLNQLSDSFVERNLDQEFKILKRITFTNKHAEKIFPESYKDYKDHNRYFHILPFVHSMHEPPTKSLIEDLLQEDSPTKDNHLKDNKSGDQSDSDLSGTDSDFQHEELINMRYLNGNYVDHVFFKNWPLKYFVT